MDTQLLALFATLRPEQQTLVRDALARAWDAGYDTCYGDGGEDLNPYRKQQGAAE